MENWGYRVQYSVFECDLDQPRCVLMVERLGKLICAKDSIRVYRICQACASEVTVLGRGRPVMRDRDFYDVFLFTVLMYVGVEVSSPLKLDLTGRLLLYDTSMVCVGVEVSSPLKR